MQEMKQGKGYRVALCGTMTALAVFVLLLGHMMSFGEFFWYYVASLLIDLPERTMDKALCFLATSLVAAILCGFHFIYLAAFCLLMGPYVVIKAVVSGRSGAVQYCAVSAVAFCGFSAVCWLTPMFFVQLSTVHSSGVLALAAALILAASLCFEPLYGRLYLVGKQLLLKVWFRLA